MERTLDIERLKQISPDIYFSEWKINKSARIKLYDILIPERITYKETKYYVFDGCFVKDNYLHIEPNMTCRIWITEQCFETEIIRHIDFLKITKETCIIEVEFDLLRLTDRRIKMMNFKRLH